LEICFVFNCSDDYVKKKFFRVGPGFTVRDLKSAIRRVGAENFFPVFDRNSMWVLKEKDDRDIFVMSGDLSAHLLADGPLTNWIDDLSNPELYFDYYPSYEDRAKRIYFKYNGNIYGAAFEEYAHYRVTREKEAIWDSELARVAEKKAKEINIARAKQRSHTLFKHNLATLAVGAVIAAPLVWSAFVFFIYPYLDETVLNDLPLADVLLGAVTEDSGANLATLLIGIGLIFIAASVVILAFQKIEKNKKTIKS
jgi:ABC-type multidrug transport system fused ATPase/permease subunit